MLALDITSSNISINKELVMNRLEVGEYDTAEGIREHLGSLDDLRQLLDTRREASRFRNEDLNEWCLLGRFTLNCVGSIGLYDSVIPAEVDPLIPDVLHDTDLRYHMNRKLKDIDFVICYSDVAIPNSSSCCSECHEGWTVRSAHDVSCEVKSDVVLLNDFTGQTINDVNEDLKKRRTRDGERIFNPKSWLVRSPYATDHEQVWHEVDEDYKIGKLEEGNAIHYRYLHPDCKRERDTTSQRERFEAAIEEAGIENYEMQPITNQYEGNERGLPWYRVTTENGKPFLIGWRRRVINIAWLQEDYSLDIPRPFSGDEEYVHAHGYNDASQHLSMLRIGFGL